MTASRNYEPYEQAIIGKSMLPNIAMSFCTTKLKVEPVDWFVRRELGWRERYHNVLGMRFDEPKRVEKALFEECQSEYPLYHARVVKARVNDFWRRHSFDLGIHGDQGNCDLCFKKGRAKLERLIHANPELADWWLRMEKSSDQWAGRRSKKEQATFSKRWTYRELVAAATAPGWTPPPEQMDFDDVTDCFCGLDDA